MAEEKTALTKEQRISELVTSLPEAIAAGEAAIVRWLSEFSTYNEPNQGFDAIVIANALKSAGYENDKLKRNNRGTFSNVPPKEVIPQALKAAGYKSRDDLHDKEMKANPKDAGKFLIGQVIDHFEKRAYLHPMAYKFAKTYEETLGGGRADGRKWGDALGPRTGATPETPS